MSTTRTNTAVWLEKYQRWQIKVQKDGERKTFTCSTPGRKGQIECNAEADKWLCGITMRSMRAKELYDNWIDELKLTTSKSYWSDYECVGRLYIKPEIGMRKVEAINEQHLQNVILKNFQSGKKGKPLSYKYLKTIRDCMSAFMKYARKCGQTNLRPENLYVPKSAPRGQRTILQPASIEKLFSSTQTFCSRKIQDDTFVHAYRFAVATGLRPGELLELTIENIFENMVRVSGSQNVYGEHTTGKNQNAQRDFALNDITRSIVLDQKRLRIKQGFRCEYFFCNKSDNQATHDQYRNAWMRYRTYNGLEDVTPYELRHTFVSLVQTLPDGTIKPFVGHSQNFDTRGVYAHDVGGEKEAAAFLIGETLKKFIKTRVG